MTTEQKVRQTIVDTSKKICNEVGDNLNIKFDSDALDLIAEMTYKKLSLYGADLEAFQKHSKRSQINMDDVKLLVRRNESLKELVNERAQFILKNRPLDAQNVNKRKRKNTASTNK